MSIDPRLLEFCKSDSQRENLEAIIKHGSAQKAARAIGKSRRVVDRSLALVKGYAELKGYSPDHNMTRPTLDHLMLTGHSDLEKFTDDKGEVTLRWNKYGLDKAKLEEMLHRFTEAYMEDLPRLRSVREPKARKADTDIIPWFQIGDAHLGMLAHEWEVGHNFDLKIAERELLAALSIMIHRAPDCERCVIQDLGDFTHYENTSGVTEHSRHMLDVDGRFPKMIEVYSRVMRQIVETALAKFKRVDVIVNQGNHSRTNDQWMAVFLRNVYENTPRLNVLNNASVFIPYRMGNTFVLCHHTDKCKPPQLAQVMAQDFAQDWGESVYRYIDGGHVHHRQVVKEMPGAIYESWNQLAPSDKYAHDGGWRSRSCLSTVLRSRTYGEKGRLILTAEEVQDTIHKLKPGTIAQKRREVHTV